MDYLGEYVCLGQKLLYRWSIVSDLNELQSLTAKEGVNDLIDVSVGSGTEESYDLEVTDSRARPQTRARS